LIILGQKLEFTQELAVCSPGKFKDVVQFSVMGKNFTQTAAFNGKEGWLKLNDMDIPVKDELLREFTETAHWMNLSDGLFLKDKSSKLSLLGEVQVNGKPALGVLGVKVETKGKNDVDLFFDKATGLVAKTQRRAHDFQSNQEVTDEHLRTEYQDLKGRKVPKKIEVIRDGKELLKAEYVEWEWLDRIEDSEFVRP
jgi:hypothetical protein